MKLEQLKEKFPKEWEEACTKFTAQEAREAHFQALVAVAKAKARAEQLEARAREAEEAYRAGRRKRVVAALSTFGALVLRGHVWGVTPLTFKGQNNKTKIDDADLSHVLSVFQEDLGTVTLNGEAVDLRSVLRALLTEYQEEAKRAKHMDRVLSDGSLEECYFALNVALFSSYKVLRHQADFGDVETVRSLRSEAQTYLKAVLAVLIEQRDTQDRSDRANTLIIDEVYHAVRSFTLRELAQHDHHDVVLNYLVRLGLDDELREALRKDEDTQEIRVAEERHASVAQFLSESFAVHERFVLAPHEPAEKPGADEKQSGSDKEGQESPAEKETKEMDAEEAHADATLDVTSAPDSDTEVGDGEGVPPVPPVEPLADEGDAPPPPPPWEDDEVTPETGTAKVPESVVDIPGFDDPPF